jgi:hypothetical protein
MQYARKRGMFWERWNVASAFLGSVGRTQRLYKSILYMIFIRFYRMKLCAGAPRDTERLGITQDRRCSDLSMKWIAPALGLTSVADLGGSAR